MADPSIIPGMPAPRQGVMAFTENVGEKVLVNDEDILSARIKTDIEGFATPFALAMVAIVILLWMRRFAKQEREVAAHAK